MVFGRRFAVLLLLRHVTRAMYAVRLRLLVISLICAATFGVEVGTGSAIDSLFETVATLQAGANMADLELLTAPDDLKNLPDFAALSDVMQAEWRLLSSGRIDLGSGTSVSALHVGADPQQFASINRLTLLDGQLPLAEDPEGVVLERNCASYYHKRPGDRLTLSIGSVTYPLVVRGIVQSPEYLIMPLNPSVYVPSSGSLCVLFGSAQPLAEAMGFAAFNSLLLRFAPGDLRTQREAALTLAQTRLSVDYSLTRAEQFSQKALELDLNTFRVFLPALVGILALASICVVFFLMVRWIQGERQRIAVLLTLGYRRRQIATAYMLPALVLLTMALLVGLPSAWFNLWSFGTNYATAIGMPDPALQLHLKHVAGAALMNAATIGLGCWLPIRTILSIEPIETLRDLSSANDEQRRIGRVALLIGGPFWFRYAARNLLRNWPVTLVSLLMVGLSLAVSVSFHISLSSIGRAAHDTFAGDRWEAVVDFDAPQWDETLGKLQQNHPGTHWVPFVRGGAHVIGPSQIDLAYLVGSEPGTDTRRVQLLEGRQLRDGDADVALVERRLAADHQAGIGQTMMLHAYGDPHPITVVGIHSSAIPGEIVVPRATGQRLLGLEEQFTGAFLVGPLPDQEAVAKLLALPAVLRVTVKPEIDRAIVAHNYHVWILVRLSALTSIFISALFLLAATMFTIAGHSSEYGTLRLLGHDDRTIIRIVFTEIALQVCGAAAVTVPIALLLAHMLNERLTNVWFKVATHASVTDFAQVLLPAVLFVPCAALPALWDVLNTPLDDALKERRFG